MITEADEPTLTEESILSDELMDDPRRLLTTKQAAALLSVSPYTLNEYVRKGYIRTTRLEGHKHKRFRLDALHAFIDSRTED